MKAFLRVRLPYINYYWQIMVTPSQYITHTCAAVGGG